MKSKLLLIILLSSLFVGCKALQKQPKEIGVCKVMQDPIILCVNGEYVGVVNTGLLQPKYTYTNLHMGDMNVCTCQGVENETTMETTDSDTPYLEIAE